MQNILVLCVGNICRSPLAEALLAQKLPQYQISSAGLSAMIGWPADAKAQDIATEHGLDIAAHRAQQVTRVMCQYAELILVMEQAHKTRLEQKFPLVRGKTFRLGHFSDFDVADPYRQPRAAFDHAWDAIARGVADWIQHI